MTGDKAEVYQTTLLKQYPFPEFEGENFISEIAVWDTIAKNGYQLRWFPEIIYKCEYRDDGLTQTPTHRLQIQNFQGFTYTSKLIKETEPFPYNCYAVGQYAYIARQKGIRGKEAKQTMRANIWQFWLGKMIFWANEWRKKLR